MAGSFIFNLASRLDPGLGPEASINEKGCYRISSGALTPSIANPEANTEVNEKTNASLALVKSRSFSLTNRNCG
jgi:hypothetical protein